MTYKIRCFKDKTPTLIFCSSDSPRYKINKQVYEMFGKEYVTGIRVVKDVRKEINKFNTVFA